MARVIARQQAEAITQAMFTNPIQALWSFIAASDGNFEPMNNLMLLRQTQKPSQVQEADALGMYFAAFAMYDPKGTVHWIQVRPLFSACTLSMLTSMRDKHHPKDICCFTSRGCHAIRLTPCSALPRCAAYYVLLELHQCMQDLQRRQKVKGGKETPRSLTESRLRAARKVLPGARVAQEKERSRRLFGPGFFYYCNAHDSQQFPHLNLNPLYPRGKMDMDDVLAKHK